MSCLNRCYLQKQLKCVNSCFVFPKYCKCRLFESLFALRNVTPYSLVLHNLWFNISDGRHFYIHCRKIFLCTFHEHMCGVGVEIHSFTSPLEVGERSTLCPGCFTPRETAVRFSWQGECVGARVSMDVVEVRWIAYFCTDKNPESSSL